MIANGVEEDLDRYDPALASDPLADESLLLDRSTPWFEAHYRQLVEGISSLDLANGYSSRIYLFGDKVFPVALNPSKDVVVGGVVRGQVGWAEGEGYS